MDERLVVFVADHRIPALDELSRGAMAIGTSVVVIMLVAVAGLVYVVHSRQVWLAWAVAVAFGSSTLVGSVLKGWIDRARPPAHLALVLVYGPSMPSTHAAWTAAVALALVLIVEWPAPRVRRLATIILALVVSGIGGALVYLGVHWPTDVLAGWLLGVLAGALSAWSATAVKRRTRPRPT